MKKLIASLTLALALTACGGGGASPDPWDDYLFALAKSLKVQESSITLYNVKELTGFVCGYFSVVGATTKWHFYYNGTVLEYGSLSVEKKCPI